MPETNEAELQADDTILTNNSQIALLVVVGVLSTLLVTVILAVVVALCYVFGRTTADGQAIANLPQIRYHPGANDEGKFLFIYVNMLKTC